MVVFLCRFLLQNHVVFLSPFEIRPVNNLLKNCGSEGAVMQGWLGENWWSGGLKYSQTFIPQIPLLVNVLQAINSAWVGCERLSCHCPLSMLLCLHPSPHLTVVHAPCLCSCPCLHLCPCSYPLSLSSSLFICACLSVSFPPLRSVLGLLSSVPSSTSPWPSLFPRPLPASL